MLGETVVVIWILVNAIKAAVRAATVIKAFREKRNTLKVDIFDADGEKIE